MEVTEAGMVKLPVKPLQPSKALYPMEVTEAGMVKLPVNPLQPAKAQSPMEVMLPGRVIPVKLVLPASVVGLQNEYSGIWLAK